MLVNLLLSSALPPLPPLPEPTPVPLPVAVVQEVLPTPAPPPPTIQERVQFYADKYQLSAKKTKELFKTIENESGFDPNAESGIISADGTPEQSFGVAQIHLPDHPDISKAEALDPEFALDFMAREFKAGHEWLWSCWRALYGK